MKTVDKALKILDQFSLSRTEIGLSELARMAELDKAATRRLLVALSKHRFIEQNEENRRYRLGDGFLRLARIREATMPISDIAQSVTDWLVGETNETVHVSVPGSQGMTTIAYRLPNRGRVVNIIPSEVLNYHATASGLVFLAFASETTAAKIMRLKREKITRDTITAKAELTAVTKQYRAQGYAVSRNSFEEDVASLALPFFQKQGDPTGTIAVALARDDLTDARRDTILPLLKEAVARIEKALTGL